MIPRVPMLAATIESLDDLASLQMPLWASRKENGIRGLTDGKGCISRTLKPIPNKFIQSSLSGCPAGLEGELITLDEKGADDDFEDIESKVMSRKGEPDFEFRIFDSFGKSRFEPYRERYKRCCEYYTENVFPIRQIHCGSIEQIKTFYKTEIGFGSEGIILRNPSGFYKFGRSTLNEQLLLKLKPWNSDEATVLDVLEEFENTNPSLSDERGYSKRSKHGANLKGKNTMGALLLRSEKFGEFKLGSGWTEEQKQEIWNEHYKGKIQFTIKIQYRYRGLTKYGKPKHASFLKWI